LSLLTIKKIKLSSREKYTAKLKKSNIKSWKRQEILLDPKFYLISLVMLALPAINTGVFVYQSYILESKNWGDFVIAKSFMFYSVLSVATLFISGPLVDKFTSRKILPLMNIPSFFAMLILFYFDNHISSYFLLGLMGISNGLANVLGSSKPTYTPTTSLDVKPINQVSVFLFVVPVLPAIFKFRFLNFFAVPL